MTKKILLAVFVLLALVGIYHTQKPLPSGLNLTGTVFEVNDENLHFFSDKTYLSGDTRVSEQEIFSEIFSMIDGASEYILIDMFFYSDFIGVETEAYRYLSRELTDALITKKESNPDMVIQVVTDPINVMYGGHRFGQFEELKAAGIDVIVTDLRPLRDSNPLYSSVWRTFFQWFGNSDRPGYLPNPLDQKSQKLGLRTYLKMLNYKANHRKVVVADFAKDGKKGLASLVTSANPHDGSSAHSNIAVRVDTHIWQDLVRSEAAAAALSGFELRTPSIESSTDEDGRKLAVQVLTERAIKEAVIAAIDSVGPDGVIDMAMFYISDRDIVRALRRADERGTTLRLLLDANKDAFGREKNGTPNRQVAHELQQHTEGNTTIRWCNTHGEQCHAKLLLVHEGDSTTLIQGSANFTRRNLENYNLETNIQITGDSRSNIFADAQAFFDEHWSNTSGAELSVAYEVYEDTSRWRQFMYRLKEWSGVSRW